MTALTIKDLLLAPRLDPQQVQTLLTPYALKDFRQADANLQAMADDLAQRHLLADILEDVLICVSKSADPDQALNYLERFARAAFNKSQLYSYLKQSPQSLEILTRALGGSAYMTEILIRDPHHFYWVTDPEIFQQGRQKRQIQRELIQTLKIIENKQRQLDYLRAVKRKEMLLIGIRDLLRFSSVGDTLSALSALAEALISAAYWICASALRREYDIPSTVFTRFTVLAMGKLGGAELNFSSDVDLIYLYASDQEEYANITASEYFRKLSQHVTAALHDFTSEGYVYRVDLRLRPEGRDGKLAYGLDGFQRYYQTRIGTWERLALLKAWPVAGNRMLGAEFLAMARTFIYDSPFDRKAIEDIQTMKRRTDQKMAIRRQRDRNVKLGAGGIREIELIVQSLQVSHGAQAPSIRQRNTLQALSALCDHSLISRQECDALTAAYIFLRDVENKLQMVNDAQTHSLPENPQELTVCARLLGYARAEDFLAEYRRHTAQVSGIFEEVLNAPDLHRFSSAL
jgi:[glutamine synthetase] adenylyltransferase / [glutamine synthetase]-adenylyl-L-tyrosine phosphorylase